MKDRFFFAGRSAVISTLMLITALACLGDAVGGPKHFNGNLSKESYDEFPVDFVDGKIASFKAYFSPHSDLWRYGAEFCSYIEMKMYDSKGAWMQTIVSHVEADKDGQPQCVAALYQSVRKKEHRRITARLVNRLKVDAFFQLETN